MRVVLIIHSSNESEARREEYDISCFEIESQERIYDVKGTETIHTGGYLILHLENGCVFIYEYIQIVEITSRDGIYYKYENGWFSPVRGKIYRIVLER